jgi:hypothetical protein
VTLSGTLALIGGITGPLGFVISLLVFFRDRARIAVSVSWDMEAFPRPPDYPAKFAMITIVNIGRRPTYVSHVSAREEGNPIAKLIAKSVPGRILSEGSAPYSEIMDEQPLAAEEVPWWKLRFSVSAASGRLFFSPWLERPPKWATTQTPPKGAAARNRRRNQIDRLLSAIWF